VTLARPTATHAGDAPTPGMSPTLAEAARLIRETVRDKSYQLTPIGADAAGSLRAKRKRLEVVRVLVELWMAVLPPRPLALRA
jgi:hypothetical protein